METLNEYLPMQDETIKTQFGKFRYMMFLLPIAMHARVIVETGLSQGFSTRIFCESAKLIGAKVFTYDIEDFPETRKKIEEIGLSSLWNFTVQDSVEGGKEWSMGKIDILFLDSSHETAHVKAELEAWTPHLRSTGIILIHDTHNPVPKERPDCTLAGAKEFVKEHKGWFLMNSRHECGMAVLWRIKT